MKNEHTPGFYEINTHRARLHCADLRHMMNYEPSDTNHIKLYMEYSTTVSEILDEAANCFDINSTCETINRAEELATSKTSATTRWLKNLKSKIR